jgi:excisionase family DNA binding protein
MSTSGTGLPKDVRRLVTSVSGACYALDCGRDRLYELLNTGEIESYLDGRSRKILVTSLDAYVARRLSASKDFERARHPAPRSANP